MAFTLHGRLGSPFCRSTVALHYVVVRAGDAGKGWVGIDPKNECVVQASRGLQHRAAASAAAEDRNASLAAGIDLGFDRNAIRVSYDNECLPRFPEAQDGFREALLASVQEGFVQSEIFRGRA